MSQFYMFCLLVVMALFGMGIFSNYVQNLKKSHGPSSVDNAVVHPKYLTEQQDAAAKAEAERKKAMEELKDQIDRDMIRQNPTSRGF